jgi:hypothetical protein
MALPFLWSFVEQGVDALVHTVLPLLVDTMIVDGPRCMCACTALLLLRWQGDSLVHTVI